MFARTRPATFAALLLGALFTIVTAGITWAEYKTFNTTSLDLAVYSQLVWNAAQGHPFETTLLLQNRLHLAEHLALALLPLAPVYGLAPDVRILLGAQQAMLALSGAPVFWYARRVLGAGPGLVVLACYYAMPTLAEVALDAFYPIAMAAAPVALGVALALAGFPRAGVLALGLALLMEEEAALPVIGLGLSLILVSKSTRRLGLAAILVGAVWLGLAGGLAMPKFHQASTRGVDTRAEGHFEELRDDPAGWLGTVATTRLDPDLVGALGGPRTPCQQPGQCSALRWWLYPTAGLPLLAPTSLAAATPTAAALLLADKPGRFRRHWAAPMLPIIWVAAASGLAVLARRRLLPFGLVLLVSATALTYRLDNSLPGGSQFEPDDIVLSGIGQDLDRLTRTIPLDASVGASRRALAHLANRREVYAFPADDYGPGLWPSEPPSFLLLDLRNEDTVRELRSPSGPLGRQSQYRVLDQTPNAVLLERIQ